MNISKIFINNQQKEKTNSNNPSFLHLGPQHQWQYWNGPKIEKTKQLICSSIRIKWWQNKRMMTNWCSTGEIGYRSKHTHAHTYRTRAIATQRIYRGNAHRATIHREEIQSRIHSQTAHSQYTHARKNSSLIVSGGEFTQCVFSGDVCVGACVCVVDEC